MHADIAGVLGEPLLERLLIGLARCTPRGVPTRCERPPPTSRSSASTPRIASAAAGWLEQLRDAGQANVTRDASARSIAAKNGFTAAKNSPKRSLVRKPCSWPSSESRLDAHDEVLGLLDPPGDVVSQAVGVRVEGDGRPPVRASSKFGRSLIRDGVANVLEHHGYTLLRRDSRCPTDQYTTVLDC